MTELNDKEYLTLANKKWNKSSLRLNIKRINVDVGKWIGITILNPED
jgi:hypothetical protein